MQIIEILELFAFSIILRSYRTDLELFEMKHELFFDLFLFWFQFANTLLESLTLFPSVF